MKQLIILFLIFFTFQKQFSQNGICFTQTTSLANSYMISTLCHADFNNDGQVDFVYGWSFSTAFSLRLSSGSAGYSPATNLPLNYSSMTFVAAGDFNADANKDVALTFSDSNFVRVLLGTGTGSFNASNRFPVGIRPIALVVKDLNGDGNPDLAVCNEGSDDISILNGNGSGGFSSPVNFTVGYQPHAIVSADFNNDGKNDLAVCNRNTVSILKGNANGGFTIINTLNLAFGNGIGFSGGGHVTTVTDLNNDGKPDLAGIYRDSLYIALNTGNFSFGNISKYYAGNKLTAIDCADLNNDGKLDLLTSNYASKDYAILVGNGLGGIAGIITKTVIAGIPSPMSANPQFICAVDCNNDNKQDIVMGFDNDFDLAIVLNCNTVNVGTKELTSSPVYIELYPNPNSGSFLLRSNTDVVSYAIFNMFGQLVMQNDDQAEVNTETLSEGIYFISVRNRNNEQVKLKFVKE